MLVLGLFVKNNLSTINIFLETNIVKYCSNIAMRGVGFLSKKTKKLLVTNN